MGINISLSDMKINDNAKVLNNASIKSNEDVSINLQSMEINGQAAVLNDLEIDSVLQELNKRIQKMDKNSDEYFRIQEILKVKRWKKKNFINCVIAHMGEFSQGVLASVLANFLTK